MGTELIYDLNKDIQPFVAFEVEIKPKQIISCVGYEFICSNPKCDCQLVHVGIYEKGSRKVLTYIIYGWHDYNHYVSKGHAKEEAKAFTQGKLSDSQPEAELNKSILLAFREWVSKNKAQNNQIFAERYKQFKSAVRNKQMSKAKNVKLKKFFSMMLELFGEEKVEEFIAGCEQPSKVSYISNSKKKSIV